MITELEQEFFKIYEIEPIPIKSYGYWLIKGSIAENDKGEKVIYPEITDRRLLEMICIFSQHCNFGRWNKYAMHSIDDFEYIMLGQLIEYQKKRYTYGIKEKIQQIFKKKGGRMKNKCVGLDCEMCGNTKCPNEEKEKIINGIDASEEIRYCNNCSNLGLDFKTGKFYCGLSNRNDELPEILSCENFSSSCYIKRLQEENKRLQMLSCANCGEKYLSPDGAELYEKNVQLQKENEELKEKIESYNCNANCYKYKEANKYKQALEEIRNYASVLYGEPLIDGSKIRLKSGMYRIKTKINEALNDRD